MSREQQQRGADHASVVGGEVVGPPTAAAADLLRRALAQLESGNHTDTEETIGDDAMARIAELTEIIRQITAANTTLLRAREQLMLGQLAQGQSPRVIANSADMSVSRLYALRSRRQNDATSNESGNPADDR
ncbi:hypothetical protein MUG78_17555 [Gordonia alkaliphila]|uniref:hypothetical protein n=1 Tax=Gordonia alkaliphila TaxID=1053547 RepID=UPI001FF63D86|nr:hypothetical protein [Gordonia alkaliphila]MCK0441208.1 hypothetical protein [Gordonia alkaliphila]